MPYRPRRRLAFLALLALLAAVLPQADRALAATFMVTTTADAPHSAPVDGTCTSILPGNVCTLRAAVQAANHLGGSHEIRLAVAGTYFVSFANSLQPGEENAAALGDLDLNGASVTITNLSGGVVTIDGNQQGRLFDVGPLAPADLTLSRLTLQHGNLTATGGDGAAILVHAGSRLTITDSVVRNNTEQHTGNGGAIANAGSASLSRVSLRDNTAAIGGAILNRGVLTLDDVFTYGNQAFEFGGGVYNTGTATVTHTHIGGNSAVGSQASGGGIAMSAGTMVLTDTTIGNNGVLYGPGGGGILLSGGTLALTNVTVANNFAGNVSKATDLQVTGGALNLTNSIVSNVGSESNGILIVGDDAEISPLSPGARNCQGSITSGGHNLDNGRSCQLSGPGDLSGVDPSLGTADFTLFAPAYPLLPGSPAIDAGTNAGCPTTDQRGVARPVDGTGRGGAVCDIGAYEYQPPPPGAQVGVTVGTGTGGRLPVTVSARPVACATSNGLRALRIVGLDNAIVEGLPGQAALTSPTSVDLPAHPTQVTFTVRQAAGGQAATARLVVTDACGDWPTLVGGGPSVFSVGGMSVPAPAEPDESPTPTPGAPGFLEVCKQTLRGGPLTPDGTYTFTVSGTGPTQTVSVPLGGCSPALQVASGAVTITETGGPTFEGANVFSLASVTATGQSPSDNRLVSSNLPANSAVVTVVPGNITTQTIATFINQGMTGLVKVCKVAGPGVPIGTSVQFNISGLFFDPSDATTPAKQVPPPSSPGGPTPTPFAINVPAGPAPAGYCVVVPDPFRTPRDPTAFARFIVTKPATITEVIPPGQAVSSIAANPASRQNFQAPGAGVMIINVGVGTTEVTYTDTGTGAPTLNATTTATPTVTATATPAPICTPRPPVTLTTTPSGGSLRVMISASADAHALLQTVRIGAATNALVDANGQTGLTGNTTLTLPAGTQQTTLTVRRATAGQATTVPLVITDSCGAWPTFVGGGPGAF